MVFPRPGEWGIEPATETTALGSATPPLHRNPHSNTRCFTSMSAFSPASLCHHTESNWPIFKLVVRRDRAAL